MTGQAAGRRGRTGPGVCGRGDRRVRDDNLEPPGRAGQFDAHRLSRALRLVRLDRAGAGLTHREADLIEKGLLDSAAPRDGGGDQPGRADVHGQRREAHFDSGHDRMKSVRSRYFSDFRAVIASSTLS
jgi:hypothetical protein